MEAKFCVLPLLKSYQENLPQEAELTEDKEHDKALRRRGFSGLFSNHRRKYYCADIVEQ